MLHARGIAYGPDGLRDSCLRAVFAYIVKIYKNTLEM